jgi:hypothetical protein
MVSNSSGEGKGYSGEVEQGQGRRPSKRGGSIGSLTIREGVRGHEGSTKTQFARSTASPHGSRNGLRYCMWGKGSNKQARP